MEQLLEFAEANPLLSAWAMFWLPWPMAFAVCWLADVIAQLIVKVFRL